MSEYTGKRETIDPRPQRATLFVTCLVDQFRPQVGDAVVSVLEQLGVEVDVPPDQTCCGQPAFNSGFRKESREVARRFLDVFDGDAPIVCPSGSCGAMVRNFYPVLFRDEPAELERVQRVADRLWEFSEFIVDGIGESALPASAPGTATYHKCCHALRELGIDEQPAKLLNSVEGLEIRPMERSEVCCGFGGSFSVKMPDISTAMLTEKLDNIEKTGASRLIAGDTGCLMHMEGGLRRRGSNVKVSHTAEALDEAMSAKAGRTGSQRMKPVTREFREKAADTMSNVRLQSSLENVYNNFYKNRLTAAAATENWEDLRTRGKEIKDHTIANLDYYLDVFATNVERNGGHVFFAKDAAEANQYALDLARRESVKTVIKSKSMVSEEMGLNHVLENEGIDTVETDLGEYIIQLAGETPYHLIAPAIHKSKEEVADLLADKSGGRKESDATAMTMQAREQLRAVFQRADMSVTGVNFGVAESGSIALVTNEGNGRMATSVPRIHLAVMGMEKMIPSVQDLSTMLRILIRSATGQRISSYVTMVNGPRKPDEEDGPEQFHLIIMDNGRSKLLGDLALREALNCIRCGACLNACPVYRKVGGHSYGWVYPGPIGAIVSPALTGLKDGKNLPYASSLCGACHEACPVKINIPRMLLELRAQVTEGEPDPEQKSRGRWEPIIWKGWKWGMMDRKRYERGSHVGRAFSLPFASDGWLRGSPPPVSGWTSSRDFPLPAKESFVKRFNRRKREGSENE